MSIDSLTHLFDNGIDLANRTIYIDDEIDDALTGRVIRALKYLEAKSEEPIKVYINSIGGDVYGGFAIYDTLMSLQVDVITIGTGIVASIAAIIYLAGDKRYMTDTACVMIHPVSMWLEASAPDIRIEAKEINRLEKIRIELLASHSAKPAEFWKKIDRNRYFTPDECRKHGICD